VVMFAVWVNMFVTKEKEAYTGIAFMAAGAGIYMLFLRRPASGVA
jgi:hypothetical protein